MSEVLDFGLYDPRSKSVPRYPTIVRMLLTTPEEFIDYLHYHPTEVNDVVETDSEPKMSALPLIILNFGNPKFPVYTVEVVRQLIDHGASLKFDGKLLLETIMTNPDVTFEVVEVLFHASQQFPDERANLMISTTYGFQFNSECKMKTLQLFLKSSPTKSMTTSVFLALIRRVKDYFEINHYRFSTIEEQAPDILRIIKCLKQSIQDLLAYGVDLTSLGLDNDLLASMVKISYPDTATEIGVIFREILQMLFDAGADVRYVSDEKHTMLSNLVYYSDSPTDVKFVLSLFDAGMDKEMEKQRQLSAFVYSTSRLTNNGRSNKDRSNNGQSNNGQSTIMALDSTFREYQRNFRREFINLLSWYRHGSFSDWMTPLTIAAYRNSSNALSILKILIDNGADPTIVKDKVSAIALICSHPTNKNIKEIMQLLAKAEIDYLGNASKNNFTNCYLNQHPMVSLIQNLSRLQTVTKKSDEFYVSVVEFFIQMPKPSGGTQKISLSDIIMPPYSNDTLKEKYITLLRRHNLILSDDEEHEIKVQENARRYGGYWQKW